MTGHSDLPNNNSFETSILSEKFARDLKWMISSSPIIDPKIFDFHKPLKDLTCLDQKDEKARLSLWLKKANLKMLGPYFEALWTYYLKYLAPTEIVAQNLQVRSDKKTIGEFDFIYRDSETGLFHHLEVAVKYYLGVKTFNTSNDSRFSDMAAWIGPNKNDRLDRKFIKLRDHQSKLSQNECAKPILSELGVDESGIDKIETDICLLGYLFYPFDEAIAPPIHAHLSHHRGVWVSHSKIAEFVNSLSNSAIETLYWQVQEKPFWLAQEIIDAGCLMDEKNIYQEVLKIFDEQLRPVLCSTYQKNESSGMLEFNQLVFIVPDDWEATTKIVDS